jgi:hypothetical protein
LSSHLCLGLQNSLSRQIFQLKCISRTSHACYMLLPSNPRWFDHLSNIWWWVQTMQLLIMQFSPSSCHFIPLRSKSSPQHLVLENPPLMWDQGSHTHKKQIIFTSLGRSREDRVFWIEW